MQFQFRNRNWNRISGIFRGVELESELNWRLKSLVGIGIGIGIGMESNQYFQRWNWNRNWIEHRWPGIGIELEWTIAGIAHHCLPHIMEWKEVSSQISLHFFNLKIIIFNIEPYGKNQVFAFLENLKCANFFNLPQKVWHLVTNIERKEICGVSRQSKIPYISNHFAKCGYKGELSAVFSAIYYLNKE